MVSIAHQQKLAVASLATLRLFILPVLVAVLAAINLTSEIFQTAQATMLAALAISIAGLPHGTLDVQIAARRLGRSDLQTKIAIFTGYCGVAAGVAFLWMTAPELALVAFLAISAVHFSEDWRSGVDPFLGMMAGVALIALPALTHMDEVASIFTMLTGGPSGGTVAALLACVSAPAAFGCLVFAYCAHQRGDTKSAVDVLSCLAATLCLPPLIAFAVFFCGLHSLRHLSAMLDETDGLDKSKRAMIIAAMLLLSAALGLALFFRKSFPLVEDGVISSIFMLISILTVPHFIVDMVTSPSRARCVKYESLRAL